MANVRVCTKCKKIGLDQYDFGIRWHNRNSKYYYRSECIECHKKYKRNSEQRREDNLKHLYNITSNEYNKMLVAQNYRCAICGLHMSELSQRLYVDHNHKSRIVRSLLCRDCNLALCYVKEDPKTIRNLLKYVKD